MCIPVMARFIRINVGVGDLPIALNLDSIESVDYVNRRVYTIGASGADCYHISDADSFTRICRFVDENLETKY